MNKNRQFCAGNFLNAPCLGCEILEEKPSDILYKNSLNKETKEKMKNGLINELAEILTPAQVLYSSLDDLKRIRYFLYKNKSENETKGYILKMIEKHSSKVGQKQAIKDLQRGLSILNKNRRNSPIQAMNILIEDGIFGPKTQLSLDYACKNYSLNILKKYILRGIMNNIIFDTKNKKEINTEKMVREIVGELRRY